MRCGAKMGAKAKGRGIFYVERMSKGNDFGGDEGKHAV
jgi:hypothetical protein